MADGEDEFQLVTKGHRLCAKGQTTIPTRVRNFSVLSNSDKDCFIDKDILCKRIIQKKKEISITSYAANIKAIFEGSDFGEIVCYGIGKISENIIAQYQLCVLLILKDTLLVNQVLVYDPMLSTNELLVIERLGLIDIGHNEHCRHTVDVPTLFYMPHCGIAMYNNLLYANWSPVQLSNIVIVGNSFSNYFTRLTDKELTCKAFYLKQLKNCYVERSFPQIQCYSNVFNDTAVHVFVISSLKSISANVWTQSTEPFLDTNDEEMNKN